MNTLSVLLFGIGLGLRHATDADHVVVVSALIARESGVWRAARVAALWGAGHTVAFLALGLFIVLTGVRIPETFEFGVEILVALMLVGFGVWHLARSRRRAQREPLGSDVKISPARPLALGLIHGLSGSAGIALIAVTTINSRSLAAAYLGLVALGTVVGMVLLTIAMSRPIGWMVRKEGQLQHIVTTVTALLSMTLGIVALLRMVTGGDAE